MKTQLIPLTSLDAPHEWHRSPSKIDDDALRRSIEEGGIQQPLVVLADGKRFLVVDGIRRMKVAGMLAIAKVPAVVSEIPKGERIEDFGRKLRLIVNELRQDLKPSQECALILKMKEQFKMNNTEVSLHLGMDQDTITNKTALRSYRPEIVEALDSGRLTLQAARVFNGMTDHGQRKLWEADGKDLMNSSGGKMHKELRKKYPPEKFADYYREPDKIARRLGKSKTRRKRLVKPSFTPQEKQRLLTSFEMKDASLKDATADLKQYKAEIAAAVPILHAIKRTPDLWKLVPDDMRPEIERVLEIY